jgi:xyloglucan-specific exo-beta-1,4-glucanase
VTFDKTSGTSGKATPRIFVGVASNGTSNVFVTNDGGSTCAFFQGIFNLRLILIWKLGSAVAGQPTQFLPHKGVISPSDKVLYISYSDGAGPVSNIYIKSF